MPRNALSVTRAEDFAKWYQVVIKEADLAEMSPVRGCMIIKPWGYGIWENIQKDLDRSIRETGHDNCYFPLFIPLSFIAKEAEHVEGFAKEMAVVTHHRLIMSDGRLIPDPKAELEEPLIIRPTSETIIGDAFHRWIHSHRDLPILINQWANVVRWEMRTRMFLRTTEFLWQEGHTAHANREEAFAETMKMLEVYRSLAENTLAMPVVAGEKPENERFPGAANTYSIEAMMQDGKALQAGTSHYLGTHFAEAQDIKFQTADGGVAFAHTTSWGVSTRLVGGVIMSHGDDDGLRLPPKIAPYQVVIIPVIVGDAPSSTVIGYCNKLAVELSKIAAFGQPVRVQVDVKDGRHGDKRWNWVRRGVPVICEVGIREVTTGSVCVIRRDKLRDGNTILTRTIEVSSLAETLPDLLRDIQSSLFDEAEKRLKQNTHANIGMLADLEDYYRGEDSPNTELKGWLRVRWARPEGAELADIDTKLKSLKLTIRNVPQTQAPVQGTCIFTGRQAIEEVVVGRAY